MLKQSDYENTINKPAGSVPVLYLLLLKSGGSENRASSDFNAGALFAAGAGGSRRYTSNTAPVSRGAPSL
ncbi:MAG: hypothetical protein Q7J73_09005 [Dehalococcoidales bacterium]|nr:hypothetical protein [Dehalococcoidales bacterium]